MPERRTRPTNAFVRFVNLMRAIQALPSGVALDAQEERLMQELAVRWAECDCLPVHAALQLLPDASASTAKRRIKSLAAKGLLTLEPVAHDARVRCVSPTAQGRAYIEQLDQLMQRAVRGQ